MCPWFRENDRNLNCFAIFLGGPFGPIRPIWGHLVIFGRDGRHDWVKVTSKQHADWETYRDAFSNMPKMTSQMFDAKNRVAFCHAVPCHSFTCHARPYFHVSCHMFACHAVSWIFHAMPCQDFLGKICLEEFFQEFGPRIFMGATYFQEFGQK